MTDDRTDPNAEIEVSAYMWLAGQRVNAQCEAEPVDDNHDPFAQIKGIYRAMEKARREELDPKLRERNRRLYG